MVGGSSAAAVLSSATPSPPAWSMHHKTLGFHGPAAQKRRMDFAPIGQLPTSFRAAHAQGCASKPMTYWVTLETLPEGAEGAEGAVRRAGVTAAVLKKASKDDDTAVLFDLLKTPLFGIPSNETRYVRLACDFTLERVDASNASDASDLSDLSDPRPAKRLKVDGDGQGREAVLLHEHVFQGDGGKSKIYRVVRRPVADRLYVLMKRHATSRVLVDLDPATKRKCFREPSSPSSLYRQYLWIGVVRGLFGVSDFNEHNTMIDEAAGVLYSIDENQMGHASPTKFMAYLVPKHSRIPRDVAKTVVAEVLRDVAALVKIPSFEADVEKALRAATALVDAAQVHAIVEMVRANLDTIVATYGSATR